MPLGYPAVPRTSVSGFVGDDDLRSRSDRSRFKNAGDSTCNDCMAVGVEWGPGKIPETPETPEISEILDELRQRTGR